MACTAFVQRFPTGTLHHWGLAGFICTSIAIPRTQQRNGLIHQIGNIHHLAVPTAMNCVLSAVASTPNSLRLVVTSCFAASNRASRCS